MRRFFGILSMVLVGLVATGCISRTKSVSPVVVQFQATSTVRIRIVPEAGERYSFHFGEQHFPLQQHVKELHALAKDLAAVLRPKLAVDVFVAWNDSQAVASIVGSKQTPSQEVTKALRHLLELKGPISQKGSWDVITVDIEGGGKAYLVDRR